MDRVTGLIGPDHRLCNAEDTRTDRSVREKDAQRNNVGELHRPGRFRWSAGSNCTLDRRGYSLTLFEPEVTEDLCGPIRDQPIYIRLFIEWPLLVFCSRFGKASPWRATPYAWPLDSAGDRRESTPLELIPQSSWARMQVRLVEADGGFVRAQRVITLAPLFAITLRGAIRRQSLAPFDGDDYLDAIVKVAFDFPSPASLARSATVRTVGHDWMG
jgi:hypothetical protein